MLWVHRPTKDIPLWWHHGNFIKDPSFMPPLTSTLVFEIILLHWVGHFENIAVRKIMFIYWTNRRRVFGHFTNTWTCKDINMYDNSVLAVWWYHLHGCIYTTWWVAKALSASIDILCYRGILRHTWDKRIQINYFFDVSMNHLLQFVSWTLESCASDEMSIFGFLAEKTSLGTITSCSSRHVLALHMALRFVLFRAVVQAV
jgi:hypothetical protein